jgi:uncharacterized membrane protein YedE/YeeE
MIDVFGGFALGITLGWALQRGGFCMNTAFRSILFEKDKSTLRAWLLALAINIPALLLFEDLGILFPQTAPFFWQALVLGGLLFGLGMVMAGGCGSGTYYRAGRGMIGSWGALIGFFLGTATMDGGALGFVQQGLRSQVIDVQGREATVFNLLGLTSPIGRWLVVLAVLTPIIIFLVQAPKQKFLIGWGWKRTGTTIGLLALGVWLLSALGGRDFGLSITQPTTALARFFIAGDGSLIGLPTYILLGIPLGSFYSAWIQGEAGWVIPEAKTLVRQTSGGIVMGLGAALAGGCNIGHGLTGAATLGIGSLVGMVSIMVGCWIATWLVIQSQRVQRTVSSAN